MKPITCPSRGDLSAFLLGKLSEAAVKEIAEHSSHCSACQKTLHELDTVSDPLVLRLRQQRLQSIAPELASLLGKAEAICASQSAATVPPENTLGGEPAKPDYAKVLAPPQGQDEIGRLGSYRVLKLLGQGGMGMVFQAEDPRLQRAIALKVMLPSLAANKAAKERFLREARAAAAIEHDHIVTIHQVDEDRGVPFIAMPFLKGMSLEDYIKRAKQTNKPLTLGQILKLGREIAKGLAAAHQRGLIHRDIKPANIWLDATAGGRVKILDFGLARPAESDATLTQSGMIVGTPAYMAPEQAQGLKVDGRADLFSLGVVLYRLCSGRMPWKGETAMATLMAIATEEPTSLGEISPATPQALADLVMQLLAKKPGDRPKSAKAVVEAMQSIERDLAGIKVATPVQAEGHQRQHLEERSATGPLVKAPVRKRRRRWPLVAAALLSAVGGVALWQVIIHIKTNEGEAKLKVPSGATVTIDKDGKTTVQVPGGAGQGVDEAWSAAVQKLPAEKQVEAVAAKLKGLNPGFDGKVTHKIENGVVTELAFATLDVSSIAPVKALAGLKKLSCIGNYKDGRGQLTDLSPLQGLPLVSLRFQYNHVADLAPLRGMVLTHLDCGYNNLTDLSVIQDMPLTDLRCGGWRLRDLAFLAGKRLTYFNCNNTLISDLSPLRGMPLTAVGFENCPVSDLSSLKGMALTYLNCRGTRVTDLGILKDMPIRELDCDSKPDRDAALLNAIKSLEKINGRPKNEFLKTAAAFEQWLKDVPKLSPEKQVAEVTKKLQELNPGFDGKVKSRMDNAAVTEFEFYSYQVSDIAPVRALTELHRLRASGSHGNRGKLTDLSPLRGMRLRFLHVHYNPIQDLAPLQGMALSELDIGVTQIDDLTPLKGMRLEVLRSGWTNVRDLSPVRGMPLTYINTRGARVRDFTPLCEAPLKTLECDPGPTVAALRSVKTLETINEKPAAEFWKQHDATYGGK